MKRLGSGVLFAILAACGGSSSSSPPPVAPEPAPAPVAAAATATCEGTIAKMMAMSGEEMFGQLPADKQPKWTGKFSALMITACREDGWPQAVLDCAAAAPDKAAMDACGDGLGAAEQEKMMARMEPLMQELMADMGVPAPAAEEPGAPSYDIEAAAAWTSGPSSVAACDTYLAVFEGYMACDKVPRQVVDASKGAIAAMTESWVALRSADVEARRDAAVACAAGTDALHQSQQSLGCAAVTPPPPALIAAPSAEPAAKPKKAKAKGKAKAKAD